MPSIKIIVITLGIELPSTSQHRSPLRMDQSCSVVAVLVDLILACAGRAVALHHLVAADRRRDYAASAPSEELHLPGQLRVSVQSGLAQSAQ